MDSTTSDGFSVLKQAGQNILTPKEMKVNPVRWWSGVGAHTQTHTAKTLIHLIAISYPVFDQPQPPLHLNIIQFTTKLSTVSIFGPARVLCFWYN